VSEVSLEPRPQDLVRGSLDVVLDAPELEMASIRVENDEARSVVVIARLAHRADADDLLSVSVESEVDRR